MTRKCKSFFINTHLRRLELPIIFSYRRNKNKSVAYLKKNRAVTSQPLYLPYR